MNFPQPFAFQKLLNLLALALIGILRRFGLRRFGLFAGCGVGFSGRIQATRRAWRSSASNDWEGKQTCTKGDRCFFCLEYNRICQYEKNKKPRSKYKLETFKRNIQTKNIKKNLKSTFPQLWRFKLQTPQTHRKQTRSYHLLTLPETNS